jgi:hypothetical protein
MKISKCRSTVKIGLRFMLLFRYNTQFPGWPECECRIPNELTCPTAAYIIFYNKSPQVSYLKSIQLYILPNELTCPTAAYIIFYNKSPQVSYLKSIPLYILPNELTCPTAAYIIFYNKSPQVSCPISISQYI